MVSSFSYIFSFFLHNVFCSSTHKDHTVGLLLLELVTNKHFSFIQVCTLCVYTSVIQKRRPVHVLGRAPAVDWCSDTGQCVET